MGPDDGPVLVAESDPEVGGMYRVRFRMLDESEHEARGEYLLLDTPTRLAMSFRWVSRVEDTFVSRIDVTLRTVAEGTELTFTHSGLRSEAIRDSHQHGGNVLDYTPAGRGTDWYPKLSY